jgi:CheY-like chemotaxis protein
MEKKSKIMIVDDSPIDTMLLRQRIKNLNHPVEIQSFEDSLEAMQFLRDIIIKKNFIDLPGLIFLDLNMPSMNGFSFLDFFMKFPQEAIAQCKIIVLTASDDMDDIKRSASYSNVVDFIVKPPQKIEKVVKHLF